jgi:hypothetical protein
VIAVKIERIEYMWKDTGSGGGGCPSLSKTHGPDGYAVVGKIVDAETLAKIPQIADDETAVWVPANVLDRLKDLA